MIGTQRSRTFFFATAVLLLSASLMLGLGCDSQQTNSSAIVQVRGRVLLDDVPLAGARVTFIPIVPLDASLLDIKAMSYGITDADGNYTLQQADGTAGAIKGQHTVTISKPIDTENDPLSLDSAADKVPEFYRQHGYLKRHVMPLAGGQKMDFKLSTIDPLLKNL